MAGRISNGTTTIAQHYMKCSEKTSLETPRVNRESESPEGNSRDFAPGRAGEPPNDTSDDLPGSFRNEL